MTANSQSVDALTIVSKHWGANPPAWITQLAAKCNEESQSSVAKKMGRSPSLVNMVLKNRYEGDMAGVQSRFESAFQEAAISCPVMGAISGPECLSFQARPYNPGNHVAVRLFVACKNCPFNQKNKGGGNGK